LFPFVDLDVVRDRFVKEAGLALALVSHAKADAIERLEGRYSFNALLLFGGSGLQRTNLYHFSVARANRLPLQ